MTEAFFSGLRVAVIVAVFFGVSIMVHELGHYVAARLCGLVIDAFSIGFGPAVWKRRIGRTVYRVGCLPLGGYVALPQLDPAAMAGVQGQTGSARELPRIAPWKKIVVSLSGAGGNVVLAVVVALAVYWAGMPMTTANQPAVLGYVDRDSAAYEAGLRTGDEIVAVNGAPVDQWSRFVQEASLRERVTLRVRTADGGEKSVRVPTEEWQYGIRMVGGVAAPEPCRVGRVTPGLSAAAAGVQAGDRLIAFNDEPVLSRGQLIEAVNARRGQPTTLTVERGTEGGPVTRTLEVTPLYDPDTDMVRIGIVFETARTVVDTGVRVHPRPLDQLRRHASAIFRFLGNLLSPERAGQAARQMGGPVAIVSYYVGIVRSSLMLAVWFTGFLNVNLAILNLLPVPVLDGGHIVFALWEAVRGRPPHPRVVGVLVNVFVVLFITFFLYISVRDFDRFTPVGHAVRGWFSRDTGTVTNAP
ncbi:MAG: RIP metalloprotease RseP [Lentisphaerae bacterium]|nr:RIP metalloprotease RseP [Lentisphaerota bacterium]